MESPRPRTSGAPPVDGWVLPLAEIVTVGIPFCVFKLLTGLIALGAPPLAPAGYALLALGTADLVLNVVNFGALVIARRRIGAICVADVALRKYSPGDANLGLAVDVFLSFALVALVVGCGLLLRIPAWALPIWNLAVVLNVLGAGVGRLAGAVRRRRAVTA